MPIPLCKKHGDWMGRLLTVLPALTLPATHLSFLRPGLLLRLLYCTRLSSSCLEVLCLHHSYHIKKLPVSFQLCSHPQNILSCVEEDQQSLFLAWIF